MDRLISEQAVLEAFGEYQGSISDFYKAVNAIPSAEPAHWTVDFTCSNCGCKCYPMDIDFGNYNYCPNCGRKMEEGD